MRPRGRHKFTTTFVEALAGGRCNLALEQSGLFLYYIVIHAVLLLGLSVASTDPTEGTMRGPGVGYVHHKTWRAPELPNPVKYPALCGRLDTVGKVNPPPLFCDPEKTLDSTHVLSIVRLLTSLRRDFPCPCPTETASQDEGGYKFVVAVVPAVYIDERREDKHSASKAFAEYILSRNWTKAKCGEDLVVFFSLDGNQIQVAKGSVFRSILPDRCIQAVFEESNKFFVTHTHGDGIVYILKQIREIIRGDRTCPEGMLWWQLAYILIVAVLTFLVGAMCCCFCSVRTAGFRYHRGGAFEFDGNDDAAADVAAVGGGGV